MSLFHFIFPRAVPLNPVSLQVPTMAPVIQAQSPGLLKMKLCPRVLKLLFPVVFVRAPSKRLSHVLKPLNCCYCLTEMVPTASFMSWAFHLISPCVNPRGPCWPPRPLLSWGQWWKPLTHALMSFGLLKLTHLLPHWVVNRLWTDCKCFQSAHLLGCSWWVSRLTVFLSTNIQRAAGGKKNPRWSQGSDRNSQTERKVPVNVKRASLSAHRVEPSTGWAAAATDHIWKHLETGSRLQGWPPSNTGGWIYHTSLLIFGPVDAHGSLSTAQNCLPWLLLKYGITSRAECSRTFLGWNRRCASAGATQCSGRLKYVYSIQSKLKEWFMQLWKQQTRCLPDSVGLQ